GSIRRTGNPLDAAISGEGFFAIQGVGEVTYSRRGQFVLDQNGTLVTPSGEPVLDNAYAPIQVPETATFVAISRDGTVATDEGQIGQLGVFGFSDEGKRMLQRAGNGGYIPAGAPPVPLETPNVLQGFLESSNVNAVEEMTN